MALITCPECGKENVSDSAIACPNCGFPIAKHINHINGNNTKIEEQEKFKQNNDNHFSAKLVDENKTILNPIELVKKKKRKPLIITILIISVIGIWAIWFFSTRCAYTGCHEHKSSSSSYCEYHKQYFDNLLKSYSNGNNYSSSVKSKYDLQITGVSVSTNSAATYCIGTIENTGDSTFKFVKVKGSFKDYNGNVIETGDSYAVGSEGLAPGESTSFRISCSRNSSVKSCSVSIYDYD